MPLLRPAAAVALSIALLACPKRVVVNGREMTVGQAEAGARADLDRVLAETASQPPARAAQELEALAARFGDLPAAGDALYEAAVRWRTAKRPERASADLADLLTRFPLSPRAPDAKYQLALAEIEEGRPRDGLQTISSLYDKLPEPERPEAARRAAEAAESARLWPDAVRWQSELASRSSGPERERAVARIAELVDERLSFAEVARLAEALPPGSPAQPALVMKLARIYLHLHDYAKAESAAREELSRFPDGPYAADARALADRLSRGARVSRDVLGVAVPLSGKFKAWGDAVVQGVSLALEGSGLKVIAKDTRGEPDVAARAIEELAAQEGAVAVIGAVANAEAPRAAAAAQELEVPLIALSKMEGVTEAGAFVFRNMLTASAQARALADFAIAKRGMRRFAVMVPAIPYGTELGNAFWDEVESRGGEVRAAETYDHDRTTFAPLVKDMVGKLYLDDRPDYLEKQRDIAKNEPDPYRRRKALEKLRDHLDPVVDFDAVFIPDFAKSVALIAPALAVEDVVTNVCDPKEVERIKKATGREDLRPVQLLGANGWDDPALVEKAGRYVDCAVFVDGFFAASSRPDTKRFVDAFQKRYDRVPSILEASAYDAAGMIRVVLERDRATSREEVRTLLTGLRGYHGATGDIGFDARREPEKALFFLTVDKTGIREMSPAELAAQGAGGF